MLQNRSSPVEVEVLRNHYSPVEVEVFHNHYSPVEVYKVITDNQVKMHVNKLTL